LCEGGSGKRGREKVKGRGVGGGTGEKGERRNKGVGHGLSSSPPKNPRQARCRGGVGWQSRRRWGIN